MQRSLIWIGLCLVLAAIGLWFGVKAGYELSRYLRLSHKTSVKILDWRIDQVNGGRYMPVVHFSFEYGGKSFEGERGVGRIYPNIWAAESGLVQLKTQNYTAWFNPKNPQKATFVKKFPLKPIISAAIILFLTLYFFILGFYVQRKR